MPEMMDTGASPNYDEICAVLEERLLPVFELLGSRLKDLEDGNSELKDIVFKIVSGFGDAVTEHKKGGYQEMMASKYGPDLEEIGGPYSELYGKDIKEELLDKLMNGDMGEDGVPEFIGGIKSKFAKIRGPAPTGEMPPAEPMVEEAPAEEPKPEEPAKEEITIEEKKPEGRGGDVLASMSDTLKKGPEFLKGRKKSA